jgi:eukaryotic-like serine/threonine-protein kinase
MKKIFRDKKNTYLRDSIFLSLSFSICYSLFSVVYAADWPTFRGNNQRTGFTQEQAYPPLTEQWSFQVQGDVISSPVIVDNILYVGARSGSIYALNAQTGELIWDYSSDDWIDATPTVAGSIVYVPSRDGYIYALNKDNGNLVWQADIGGPSISSPLYLDGKIYVGSGVLDKNLKVYDATDGSLLWEYPANQPIHSAPSTDGVGIYFGSNDGRIYAMSKDSNASLWNSPGYYQTIGSFGLTAVAVSSGNLYALPGHDEKKLFLMNAGDGSQTNVSQVFAQSGEAEVSSPIIADDIVYFGMGSSPHTLHALNSDSLSSVWSSSPTFGNNSTQGKISSPSMANEIMYAGTADARVVAVSSSGVFAMSDINLSTSSYTSPAISNGMVYIGTLGGKIIAYKASKIASISNPQEDEILNGTATIRGYIANPNLASYTLEYGVGETPSSWELLVSSAISTEYENDILSYWNTDILASGIYTLRLTVVETSASSTDNTAKVAIRINHPPEPPSSLLASDVPADNGNKIQLVWTASASVGLSSYKIYRGESSEFSFLASVSSSAVSYIDSMAVTGSTYTYMLRSFDGYMESSDSNSVDAYSINNDPSSDNIAPADITNLSAAQSALAGKVLLSWSAPGNDNSVGTASHYIIRYSSNSSDLDDFNSAPLWKSTRAVGGISGTSETEDVGELFGGVTYYFAIKTSDFLPNLSGVSNKATSWATIDYIAPEPPSSFTVTDTAGDHGGSLDLRWTLSADDGAGENDVYGYKIYRSLISSGYISSAPFTTVDSGITEYTDETATENAKFFYVIAAFDSSNNSEYSEEASAISADNWRFFDASNGGTVRLQDGAEVNIGEDSVNQNDNIMVTRIDESSYEDLSVFQVKATNVTPTSIIYEVKFENPNTKLIGTAILTFPYTADDIAGMNEENLRLYTYSGGRWIMINTSEVLSDENKITAEVSHFSLFRIMEYVPSGALMSSNAVYNYPNPAKGNNVTFKFHLADKAYVIIEVYNVAGEKIIKLEKANCPAGVASEIVWNIKNIASGVYIYRVEAQSASGSKVITKRLAIIH